MPTNTTARGTGDSDQDRELRRLANDLRIQSGIWQHRGLLRLADVLYEAARVAEGWIGVDDVDEPQD